MKPSQEFTIKILSPEDYEKLPYDGADDSFGMSVMATKTAYIRSTGVKDLDQGTINHEFDELMQQSSPHEINGIRYKSAGGIFKKIVPALLSLIPGVGPALGAAAGIGAGVHTSAENAAAARKQQAQQQGQLNNFFSSFKPSSATQAFAPQTQSPLSQEDFNTGLGNLDKNAAAKEQSVFARFRGLTPKGQAGSSAFKTNLASAKTSSDLARQQFIEDQRKLGSTFA